MSLTTRDVARELAVARPSRPAGSSWTLTRALVVGFGVLLVTAVLVVLAFSLSGGLSTTTNLVGERATLLLSSVDISTRRHLAPAADQAKTVARQLESGAVPLDDPLRLSDAMKLSLAAAPQLASTYYVPRDLKNVVEVNRRGDQLRSEVVDWSADPLPQRAMAELNRRPEGFWGQFVYNVDNDQTALNYREPVRIGGELIGAVVTVVTTSQLSEFLRTLVGDQNLTAFILVENSRVLAHTRYSKWPPLSNERNPLPVLRDIPDKVLASIWRADRRRLRSFKFPGYSAHSLHVDGQGYFYFYGNFEGHGGQPWLVGVHTRANTLLAEFRRLATAAVAAVVVVLLAMAGVVFLGRRLSRPVLTLADAAVEVSQHGPHEIAPLPGSRILEINTASQAFDTMVMGLREREQIRETFGRYVPDQMVDELLGDRGVLAPQSRETTTLFTDIVGFSTVSERMSPTELIAMLNEYFAVVAAPIENFGGVIHQFQGDAILATFNSPKDLPEHQEHALRAALDIQRLVAETRFAGGIELGTRIGINTGEAVCGTVGSDSRLGFTVHGDEVNLAARLEQMNKELGTRILVAESTVAAIRHRFEFTQVGELPVRGREARVIVYRVTGPHTRFEVLAS
ncbi:MAG: adenylate/guanylate cyclase domain-containing protein [Pseudomonadota bacterium]